MDLLKTHAKDIKVMTLIDLQNLFLRLLMIGQWRGIELEPLFIYGLCAVPSALIDEHGCLRKSSKSELIKRLGVLEASSAIADIFIVDVSQLFYHMVWPHGGSASDLMTSKQNRLNSYPDETEKIIVFDTYLDVSSKDHE